jgi:hypothetical protein
MSLFLPPEALCYYHNHMPQAHQTADLDTHLRVTLFALPVFVGFGAQGAGDGAGREKTKRYIALHRGFCRPVLEGPAVVYHHTPDIGLLRPAERCVLEYGAPDRSRGYVGVFDVGTARTAGEYLLRPHGVDPGKRYQVTLDNKQATWVADGHALMTVGIPIVLDTALTSELVLYEEARP